MLSGEESIEMEVEDIKLEQVKCFNIWEHKFKTMENKKQN